MKNHFAKMCRSRDQESQRRTQKPVKSVSKKPTRSIHRIEEAEPAITDDEVYCMYSFIDSSRSKYMIQPQLRRGRTSDWIEVTMQTDSGSEANCLRMEDFIKIQNRPNLTKTRVILKAYNGERVFPKGEVCLDIQIGVKITRAKFLVVDNAPSSLLSGKTCEELELLSIKRELLVNSVSDVKGLTKDAILREHNDVFTGLGYIGNYKIELTEGAVPKQDAPRTVPVALRDDLKKKLHEIEQKGHIAKVDEPTDWVSSAVYVKKRNGQLRVCLDPRELNKHVKIPKLCLPTIDDVTSRLHEAQMFTVLDAKDGFLQVKLDEDSSKLTTFHTPFDTSGLGCPSAYVVYQKNFRDVNEIIEGLEGVTAIADDLLVTEAGNTQEEALVDHDRNQIALLQRYGERNFKLKKDKFVFKQQKLKYCGLILTSEGIYLTQPNLKPSLRYRHHVVRLK